MSVIYGTGRCFNDAIEIITELVKLNQKLAHTDQLILVHGLGINSAGEVFSHAWVEYEGLAIWRGVLDGEISEFGTPIEEHLQKWQISQTTRYNVRQLVTENLRSGHFGPWEEIYDKYTRQGKREHEHSVNGRKGESREVEPGATQSSGQNSGETSMGEKV